MPQGMTAGQAMINRAVIDRGSQDKLTAYQDKQQTWLGKKSKFSGWGRFLGAAALGGLALATGGGSLLIGAAAGLGSRLGSEGGENLADRGDIFARKGKGGYKPKKLDKDDITFYKEEAGQINRDTQRFEQEFDMKQNVDAAKDAYTAFNLANIAQSYGSKAAEEAAKGGGAAAKAKSAEIAGQTPWEGVKAMGGDWKSKAGSLFKKEAGEETGKKVLSKTVTDVTEKNIIESLATKSGADITDIIPDPTKIVDIGGGASQGGNISNIFSGADVATSQLPEYASYGDALKQREKYQGMFNRFQQGGDTSSEAWDAMWNT